MNKMGATIEITTQLLQNRIQNTLEKLSSMLPMANAPMVKYFTDEFWKTYIPKEIQQEVQTKDDIKDALDIYWQHLDSAPHDNDKFRHFRAFLLDCRKHHLDRFEDVWITPETLKHIFDTKRTNPLPIKGFMSTKKNHEVKTHFL